MLLRNDKPLMAISYDTSTYFLLTQYLENEPDAKVGRIEPLDFFKNPSDEYQYINLVTLDVDERKKIINVLDDKKLDRFSYIHSDIFHRKFSDIETVRENIGLGCFIYPGVWTYKAEIGKDCIIHSFVRMAENVKIGNNVFISGNVTIAGSSKVGNNCVIGTNVLIMDHVTIGDGVKLLPSMTIRKDIVKSGTYYNPAVFEVKEMR
jgi:acetyltransferase-like isoleucine patch superfamily enzyme